MPSTFKFALGDWVEIVTGRNIGKKGCVTEIRKASVTVRTSKHNYGVRHGSIVLLKKTKMRRATNFNVCPSQIARYIEEYAHKKKVCHINLGEWRALQKLVEQYVFEVDD